MWIWRGRRRARAAIPRPKGAESDEACSRKRLRRRRHGEPRTDPGRIRSPKAARAARNLRTNRGHALIRATSRFDEADVYIADVGTESMGGDRVATRRADKDSTTAGAAAKEPHPFKEGTPWRARCTAAWRPVAEYSHGEAAQVTAGFVYRGAAIPASWSDVRVAYLLTRAGSAASR